MPRVRLELTAFRLWDWRAAYCATEAIATVGKEILEFSPFLFKKLNNSKIEIKIKKIQHAMAGNRTRVNCLEGSYAHHYTTNA